jgi:hypothetical protein
MPDSSRSARPPRARGPPRRTRSSRIASSSGMAEDKVSWIEIVSPEQAEEAQDAPLLEAYREVMAQNPHGKADNVMRVRCLGCDDITHGHPTGCRRPPVPCGRWPPAVKSRLMLSLAPS